MIDFGQGRQLERTEVIGEYLLVQAVQVLAPRKTQRWRILTRKGGTLGEVSWHGPWRQYCFFPVEGCVFSSGCLEDIRGFLQRVNEEWRTARLSKVQRPLIPVEAAGIDKWRE